MQKETYQGFLHSCQLLLLEDLVCSAYTRRSCDWHRPQPIIVFPCQPLLAYGKLL